MALLDAISNVITSIADGDLFYVGEDLTGSYQDGRATALVLKNYVLTGPLTVIGNASTGAEIRLPEDTDNGSNYVALRAPNILGSNLTFILPSADGSNGHVLTTNGSGVLSFAAPSGGASAPLTLAGGTVTNPSTPLTITQTWNDAADTFKGFTLNITNTASASASRLMEVLLAGAVRFAVGPDGTIYADGPTSNPMFSVNNQIVGGISGYGTEKAIGIVSGGFLGFSANAGDLANNMDGRLYRIGAGIIGLRGSSDTAGAALNFVEQTAPSAPSANQAVLYAEDNGSGKTRLMVRFPTGAAQVLATEP